MNRGGIELLFQYSDWANERILDAAAKVSVEQLIAPNDLGWGSLCGALVHTLDAEYIWRILLEDGIDVEALDPEDFPDVASIRARWAAVRRAFWNYLGQLSDEELNASLDHEALGGLRGEPLWHLLIHVINHGSHHRAECAALLTGFGYSPGDVDFPLFLNSRNKHKNGDTMNCKDIELLFQYNDWANERILDRAEEVSVEQLTAPNEFGWGSLRGALVHLLDAEYVWRNLLNGGVSIGELKPEDFANVSAIRARWAEERSAFWHYLNSLSDDDLAGTVSYEGDGIMRHRVLWHCLAHVVNHGTQHRGECAALLTGFGHSPGNLDFTVFLSER
ncbi:MAG: DinB family protein [Chloroflexi bacterium]|nr:DinB family protein [Chloroflexota bacterium]